MGLNGKAEMFKQRRERFMESIGADAVAILPSAPVATRSGDVEYIYRQDNDFHYLTGFAEPEAVTVLTPSAKERFVMFVRPRDKERETWTGRRAGVEGAMRDFGAEKAYPIDELDRILPRCLERAERVYFPLSVNEKMTARVLEMVKTS
ncbi:MAG TPA: aminopeptidase P N-terminal domain-containing protein, partial [Candidatus Binataceae bacterium]|nr:aminopeptidase P N-terminal domain-containing protein [Candidatus Binataceae bacterium]